MWHICICTRSTLTLQASSTNTKTSVLISLTVIPAVCLEDHTAVRVQNEHLFKFMFPPEQTETLWLSPRSEVLRRNAFALSLIETCRDVKPARVPNYFPFRYAEGEKKTGSFCTSSLAYDFVYLEKHLQNCLNLFP